MARREARFARCAQLRNAPQYSVVAPACRNHDAARFVARQANVPPMPCPPSLRKIRDVRVCTAAHRGGTRCYKAASGAMLLGFSSLWDIDLLGPARAAAPVHGSARTPAWRLRDAPRSRRTLGVIVLGALPRIRSQHVCLEELSSFSPGGARVPCAAPRDQRAPTGAPATQYFARRDAMTKTAHRGQHMLAGGRFCQTLDNRQNEETQTAPRVATPRCPSRTARSSLGEFCAHPAALALRSALSRRCRLAMRPGALGRGARGADPACAKS